MDTGFEHVDRQNGAAIDHMTCNYKHNLSTLTLPPILFHFVRFSYYLLSICSRKMVLATIVHWYHVKLLQSFGIFGKWIREEKRLQEPCALHYG
jgi:hypothetical protein